MANVIPGSEGWRTPEDMTPEELLARQVEAVGRIIGPPPVEPVYRDVAGGAAERGVQDAITGKALSPGSPEVVLGDPNNARLAADYLAQLAAYNARFTQVLDEIRKH